jgi:hypothetical protein
MTNTAIVTKVTRKQANEIIVDNNFDNRQEACVMHGAKVGLTVEQITMYAKPCFNGWQMSEIMKGVFNLTMEQVAVYAKPWFNCEDMRVIRVGFIDGLSLEEIIDANPALSTLCGLKEPVEV